jgi:hypothetical protein
MDKRILKTILVIFCVSITSLLIPIFGQWYEQQTGIMPIVFYAISIIGGFATCVIIIYNIWG